MLLIPMGEIRASGILLILMKRIIEHFLTRCLFKLNRFPVRMTPIGDIRSLAKSLHPQHTEKELIRLGPKGDGGYLVPNDLEGICACFSPGVGLESGFEKDCAELGMNVFLADNSVDQSTVEHRLFNFTQKFVGVTSNDNYMTLDNWVRSSIPDSTEDLLLQMDIEGAEYEVLMSASENLMQRFRVMIVEFHNLEQLWNTPFFHLVRRSFDKILQTHSCVHIHPNNNSETLTVRGLEIPPTMEFTFLRKDRMRRSSGVAEFPNQLDYDNSDLPHFSLPKCWYAARST